MKKIISILLLVVSVVLIIIGVLISNGTIGFKKSNTTTNNSSITPAKEEKKQINTVEDATNLLYTEYIVEDPNQYYTLIEENDDYYIFELTNSDENKLYMVEKKTGNILFSYALQ